MRDIGSIVADKVREVSAASGNLPPDPKIRVPWVKLPGADWSVGTLGLSPSEKGVYIDILCEIFDGGECLESSLLGRADPRHLPEIVLALSSLEAKGKIQRKDCKIYNPFAAALYRDATARILKARKAANTRWRKGKRRENAKNI